MPVSVGVVLPEATDAAVPPLDVADLARRAERAGLDCIWAEDRLMVAGMSVLDVAVTLAVAAAATETIGIGTAIYVPSRRPLAWAAKQVASLQQVSGGRLQLGVGIGGGDEREYLAAGFWQERRAERTDQFLRLLPGLLAGQPVRLPHEPGTPIRLLPRVPVPPVWIGGTSLPALRRAASFGDGWLSGLQTPEEFGESAARLRELAAAAGRASPRLGVVVHVALGAHPDPRLSKVPAGIMQRAFGVPADRAGQLAVAGTPPQVADQLLPYLAAGAEVIAAVCDPVPSAESVELLAETRRHLIQELDHPVLAADSRRSYG